MSKSRNVNGYVKAVRRLNAISAKLAAREALLAPLRAKRRDAETQVKLREQRLTGGQLAEARRVLATPEQGAAV